MSDGVELDAGALIALERGDDRVRALLRAALRRDLSVHVVAGVVAQVWRGGARQARTARLLSSAEVVVPTLDLVTARAVGVLSARSGHTDVVDVHVALDARENSLLVVTSDPDDIHRVDPTLPVATI